jgi:probable HAF family extracellular repeat protein
MKLVFAVCALLIAAVTSRSYAELPVYSVTPIPNSNGFTSVGFNNNDEIVAYSGGPTSIYFKDGTSTIIQRSGPPIVSAQVAGLNNVGKAAGTDAISPFIWDTTTHVFTPFSLPGIATDNQVVTGINDSNQVLVNNKSKTSGPFIWQQGQPTVTLSSPAGSQAYANDISSTGSVVGKYLPAGATKTHAVLWGSTGTLNDLGTLGGGNTDATGISTSGSYIMGNYTDATNHDHSFISTGGALTDLGTLGGNSTFASDINNFGMIVGGSIDGSGSFQPFFYYNGLMVNLNTLVSDQVFRYAYSINNNGDIVASDSDLNLYLLKPLTPIVVPEPTSLGILGFGATLLLRKKVKK